MVCAPRWFLLVVSSFTPFIEGFLLSISAPIILDILSLLVHAYNVKTPTYIGMTPMAPSPTLLPVVLEFMNQAAQDEHSYAPAWNLGSNINGQHA